LCPGCALGGTGPATNTPNEGRGKKRRGPELIWLGYIAKKEVIESNRLPWRGALS